LHGPVRLYLFEPTAKPGAEWINLIYLCCSITQLVLGSFDKMNFKFFFTHRRYNDKLSISNYLSLLCGTYSLGDSIFLLDLAFKLIEFDVSLKFITGHFRDESLQAVDSTGTDNRKHRNRIMHAPET